MAGEKQGLLARAVQLGALRRWTQLARTAPKTDLPELRQQRSIARKLKAQVDQLIHVADPSCAADDRQSGLSAPRRCRLGLAA